MNQPVIMNYKDLTDEHILAARTFSQQFDRKLANQNGEDAFPIKKNMVRLMAMVIQNLYDKVSVPAPDPKPVAKTKKKK